MMNIPLARRIIACGLPVPKKITVHVAAGHIFSLDTGPVPVGGKCEYKRIMFTVVATDTGPELLPVLTDFALSGWIKAEISKLVSGFVGSFPYYSETSQGWHVVVDGPDDPDGPAERAILNCGPEATEIEALTTAWEAALAAGKGAE